MIFDVFLLASNGQRGKLGLCSSIYPIKADLLDWLLCYEPDSSVVTLCMLFSFGRVLHPATLLNSLITNP